MKINSEQEMLNFGRQFAKNIIAKDPKTSTVIELIGDVGAGKTTFVRGLAEGLKIKKPVTSPSFTISKSYALPNKGHLVHYDFYRLPDPGLMIDDLRENLNDPHNIIIIEWSNSVKKILPKNHLKLFIKKLDDESRKLIIKDNPVDIFQKNTKKACDILPITIPQNKRIKEKTDQLSLYLDTSTPETILKLNNQEYHHVFNNALAEKLLQFIYDKLTENHKSFKDITEITFMSGPGSFTGLRIGATIINTLASELSIPLYDHHGTKHQIIIPDYGRPANISKPRK